MQALAVSWTRVRALHLPPAAATSLRWVRLGLGLWVFAAGIALMVRADLGLSSWDVLHDGLAAISSLSFGGAIIGVSVAVVLLSALLGIKPGPATVANMFLVGLFTDLVLTSGILSTLHSAGAAPRALVFLGGVAAIALGTGLYIGANLGAGPRDSLMLAASRSLRTTPGVARTALELSVLGLGIALGGEAGPGTVAFAFLIGPAIDASFRLLGMQTKGRTSRTVWDRLISSGASWIARGQLGGQDDEALARQTGARR